MRQRLWPAPVHVHARGGFARSAPRYWYLWKSGLHQKRQLRAVALGRARSRFICGGRRNRRFEQPLGSWRTRIEAPILPYPADATAMVLALGRSETRLAWFAGARDCIHDQQADNPTNCSAAPRRAPAKAIKFWKDRSAAAVARNCGRYLALMHLEGKEGKRS